MARLAVENAWHGRRREVVRVSVPFAKGRATDLAPFTVRGKPTAWRTLTRWSDRSVQWAQAQFVAELRPGRTHALEVVREGRALERTRPCAPGEHLAAVLAREPLHTEVEDPFGVVYAARLRPDKSAGPGGVLVDTPLVRVVRYRDYHRAVDPARPGIGRDYLSLTAYLTLFHGFDHAELTVILGNDYRGADAPAGDDPNLRPLGTVRLRRFSLVVGDARLAFVPRFIAANDLRPPEPLGGGGGGFRQHLIGPGPGAYLGDACSKAFCFVLYARGDDADTRAALARNTATAMAASPLYALPHVDDVRGSRALGAHGGPAPATPGVFARAESAHARWLRAGHFGVWGTWGDTAHTATTGTPRNGTSALHLALRAASRDLMEMAEGQCLQQGLRPYHLWGLDVDPSDDLWLEGLPKFDGGAWRSKETFGRRALPEKARAYRKGLMVPASGPHAMNPFDYEHFSVDLLYDFYCLTGSSFAREELRVLGQQLLGMLGARPPTSTRGEGWCMQGLALCWLATGDDDLRRFALARRRALDAARGKPPNAYAIAHEPHALALGPGISWDAPWQQAAYVLGMIAAHRCFGDEAFGRMAIDVATYMATHGWVDGRGPKYFVDVSAPERFTMPAGHGPLEGTALFASPAFVLAAELAGEAALVPERALFLKRAVTLFDANRERGMDELAADKWLQIHLDRFPRGRPER